MVQPAYLPDFLTFEKSNERMTTDTQALTPPRPRLKPRHPRPMTLDEYFRAEDRSLSKHEYHNGYRKPIAGGTFTHDNLAHKAAKLIDNFVEDFDYPYFVNGSDTKIRIDEANRTVYPDAVVICEKPIFFEDRQDTITNPRIVVEVLSFSTQKFD